MSLERDGEERARRGRGPTRVGIFVRKSLNQDSLKSMITGAARKNRVLAAT
jgi:hypothetical protein